MSLSPRQSKSAKLTSTAPSVTLDAAPAAGNLIVVLISANENGGPVTVSTPPVGYTLVDGSDHPSGVNEWLYWKIAGVSESATIGATLSTSRAWKIAVIEVADSGAGTWSLDQNEKDNGNSSKAGSGQTAEIVHSLEFCVAGITNKNGATTQGSPSNGFTLAQMVSGNNSPNDQRTGLYYKITSAKEAVLAEVSLSTQRNWAGIVATFKTTSTILGSGSAAIDMSARGRGIIPTDKPTLRVEAGFGSGPTDFAPNWVAITDYFYGATWQHGRQNELNQTAAGTGAMRLLDEFSHWDPSNIDSPFYPYVKPGLPFRAYIINGSTIYPIFRMSLERLPRVVRIADRYTEREADLVDGFAILANAGLAGFSYESEESGARVNNVCDDIGWPADARRVDGGVSSLQAIAFADDDDTRAQTHLLKVADSENGLLFCAAAGELVFVDRHELIQNAAHVLSVATFTDAAA